jgi:hypothetical protein
MRNGTADIALAIDNLEACEVWGLDMSGKRLERIPAAARNGKLAFTASVKGLNGARMYYEIVRSGRSGCR